MERKIIQNVSNHWKSMALSFLVIGMYLAWRVGNEAHVRIGTNTIMGCGEEVFLVENLVLNL